MLYCMVPYSRCELTVTVDIHAAPIIMFFFEHQMFVIRAGNGNEKST